MILECIVWDRYNKIVIPKEDNIACLFNEHGVYINQDGEEIAQIRLGKHIDWFYVHWNPDGSIRINLFFKNKTSLEEFLITDNWTPEYRRM